MCRSIHHKPMGMYGEGVQTNGQRIYPSFTIPLPQLLFQMSEACLRRHFLLWACLIEKRAYFLWLSHPGVTVQPKLCRDSRSTSTKGNEPVCLLLVIIYDQNYSSGGQQILKQQYNTGFCFRKFCSKKNPANKYSFLH